MAANEFEPDDDFTPDDESPDEQDAGDEAEGEQRQAVFVTTREPITLHVAQLDDPRAPENCALASYIDDRLVARSAMPPEAIARLLNLKLFDEPVQLGLFAFEESPGLQCRLFALVPRALLEAQDHESEPWKASVPSYEASVGADDDDDDEDDEDDDETEEAPFETILLGHIVRFEKDRRHPDDLAAEAVDILQRIINGAEPLEDADKKAIDDLLGSL
ncbi:MAG: hypothetical protein K2R93_07390 [Gemmatimonadaceae bacterium]|nr:hypothetical protein [Gemmatimonadaceae bacterium]